MSYVFCAGCGEQAYCPPEELAVQDLLCPACEPQYEPCSICKAPADLGVGVCVACYLELHAVGQEDER